MKQAINPFWIDYAAGRVRLNAEFERRDRAHLHGLHLNRLQGQRVGLPSLTTGRSRLYASQLPGKRV